MAIIVNGERIEDAQIQEEVERLRPSYEETFADKPVQEREAELLEWSQENLIERTLFRQEMARDKIPVPPAVIDAMIDKLTKEYGNSEALLKMFETNEEELRSRIAQHTKEQMMIREIGHAAPAPTPAQVREYYERNKERYRLGEQVRVSHIMSPLDGSTREAAALDVIARAGEEIRAGVPFEVVASKHDAGVDVEDLGYVFRGEMPGEFDDIVFNLGPGQVSHVFRTRLGLHIAKVYDRRPPRRAEFDEVRQQVVEDLAAQIREDAFASHLDYLRSVAAIEYV